MKIKYLYYLVILLVIGCADNISGPVDDGKDYEYQNLSWASYKYDTNWNSELEKWEYKASCFYIDTSNMCSPLKSFLTLNNYVEDTIKYHKWTEIRLPDSQIGLDEVTIELIGGSGLVNPYTGIQYYEYLDD